MTKGKRMTLKQAADFLATTEFVFGLEAIQKAAKAGRLKAQLINAPIAYYLVAKDDLIEWAADPEQHKAGRPAKGKQE